MKCEKTCKIMNCAIAIGQKKIELVEKFLQPIAFLIIRIFIALVFWKSGMTKFSNLDSAILLFEYEYQVPYLNPTFAAYSATFFEIICSFLLIIGLGARSAAAILIIMTLVIQFLVIQNHEHFYWLSLLAIILVSGAGKLSCDEFIKRKIATSSSKNKK